MSAACVAVRRLQASLRPCWQGLCITTSRDVATTAQGNRTVRKYEDSTGLECFLQHNERGVGRAWEASELRLKSFEDLQKLWILCVREQNFLCTHWFWRKTEKHPTPNIRMKKVKQTMARIKHVLTERAQEEPTPAERHAAMAKVNAS